jgi:hypothetical protein
VAWRHVFPADEVFLYDLATDDMANAAHYELRPRPAPAPDRSRAAPAPDWCDSLSSRTMVTHAATSCGQAPDDSLMSSASSRRHDSNGVHRLCQELEDLREELDYCGHSVCHVEVTDGEPEVPTLAMTLFVGTDSALDEGPYCPPSK